MRKLFDENLSSGKKNSEINSFIISFFNKTLSKDNVVNDLIVENDNNSGFLYTEFIIPQELKFFDYFSNYLDTSNKIEEVINLINSKNTSFMEIVDIITILYNIFIDFYSKRHENFEDDIELEFFIYPIKMDTMRIKDNDLKVKISFYKK